jgi:hypothetical protein
MNTPKRTFFILTMIIVCLVLHGENVPAHTQNAVLKDSVKQSSNRIAYAITLPEGNAEIFLMNA